MKHIITIILGMLLITSCNIPRTGTSITYKKGQEKYREQTAFSDYSLELGLNGVLSSKGVFSHFKGRFFFEVEKYGGIPGLNNGNLSQYDLGLGLAFHPLKTRLQPFAGVNGKVGITTGASTLKKDVSFYSTSYDYNFGLHFYITNRFALTLHQEYGTTKFNMRSTNDKGEKLIDTELTKSLDTSKAAIGILINF